MEVKEEITWRSTSIYVDVETGEQITLEEAKKEYVIINKKKHSNVYKTTGTITFTNECRRSQQLKLFNE